MCLYLILNERTSRVVKRVDSQQEVEEYLDKNKDKRLVVYRYIRKNFNF